MSNGKEETKKAVKDFIDKFENLELFIPETLEVIIKSDHITVEVSTEIIIAALINELKRRESEKWSSYLGKMTWYDAIAKAKELGMKLPTKEDFKKAYNTGITKSWEKGRYWTSDEDAKDNNKADNFYITWGGSNKFYKKVLNHIRLIKP